MIEAIFPAPAVHTFFLWSLNLALTVVSSVVNRRYLYFQDTLKGVNYYMLASHIRSGLILGSGLVTGWITCVVIIIQNLGAF